MMILWVLYVVVFAWLYAILTFDFNMVSWTYFSIKERFYELTPDDQVILSLANDGKDDDDIREILKLTFREFHHWRGSVNGFKAHLLNRARNNYKYKVLPRNLDRSIADKVDRHLMKDFKYHE